MKDELNRLRERYVEASLNGVVELEEFLKAVVSGKHGNFAPSVISAFLNQLEKKIIENMYLKLEERPEWSDSLEERIEEVHDWIEKLKKKYGG